LGLNLEQKQAVVAEVSAQLAKAQAVILAEYRSLAVGQMTELRRKARGSGVYLRVLKNTLARRAAADTPFKGLADKMVGPLAYGISNDPVAAAKVLHEFARDNEKFVIKAGAMPNVVMTPRDVAELAKMPSGTVQTLGAEKALFRHLKEGNRPPKHGVIFQHPLLHRAPLRKRGPSARSLAGALSIAARGAGARAGR
jgi:large subunit ribosomal protein L10